MVQIIGFLPPIWETCIESLTPDFSPGHCIWEVNHWMRVFFLSFFSLSLSRFLSNNFFKRKHYSVPRCLILLFISQDKVEKMSVERSLNWDSGDLACSCYSATFLLPGPKQEAAHQQHKYNDPPKNLALSKPQMTTVWNTEWLHDKDAHYVLDWSWGKFRNIWHILLHNHELNDRVTPGTFIH